MLSPRDEARQGPARFGPRALRLVLISTAVLLAALFFATYLAAGVLTAPQHRDVGPPPAGLPAEAVHFVSDSGATLRESYIERSPGRGSVLLLHGIRADRRSMLGRARFLNERGYATLLLDLQAHGESGGERITGGTREAEDASAALRYVRSRHPGEPLAAIGASLGGASLLLGEGPPDVDALVLEAVYPDLRRAIRNRLTVRAGALAAWLEPLLVWQLSWRLGIDADEARPIEGIRGIVAPVLVIAGDSDRRTTLAESRRLFEAAGGRATLWVVEGAGHVDFHRFARRAYEREVGSFLANSTRGSDRKE